jgi:hypothetical protein
MVSVAAFAESFVSWAISLAASFVEPPLRLRLYMKIRLTWTTPTQPRKKLTAARLESSQSEYFDLRCMLFQVKSYSILRGLMMKHHRVQMAPVAISAAF